METNVLVLKYVKNILVIDIKKSYHDIMIKIIADLSDNSTKPSLYFKAPIPGHPILKCKNKEFQLIILQDLVGYSNNTIVFEKWLESELYSGIYKESFVIVICEDDLLYKFIEDPQKNALYHRCRGIRNELLLNLHKVYTTRSTNEIRSNLRNTIRQEFELRLKDMIHHKLQKRNPLERAVNWINEKTAIHKM